MCRRFAAKRASAAKVLTTRPQLDNNTASQNRLSPQNFADTALKAAAGLWFLAAAIGQRAFLYYIVAFYGA